MLSFTVPGRPVPQGSMKPVPRGRHAAIVPSNQKELGEYRARVAIAAQEAGATLYEGPVTLVATFVLPRPKNHYGTGRNAGKLKASAPLHHTSAPDIDKLLRALCDGITNVAIRDDSQIMWVTMAKRYPDKFQKQPCTLVTVASVDEQKEEAS